MDVNLPPETKPTQLQSGDKVPPPPKKGSLLKRLIFLGVIFITFIAVLVGGVFAYIQYQKSQKPENVTLTYWGLWDEKAIMEPIIADFEKANPNIKIQYEMQDIKGLGQYIERLTTRINNGTGPDIIRFHSSWTTQLKNYLLPFPQAFLKQTQLEEDYYQTVERDMKLNGAYYGIPLSIDTLAMFVNTQLLQAKGLPVPDDWNEIYEKYAPNLAVKDQNGRILTSSIALGTYDNIAHASDIIAMLMLQNGADFDDLSANEGESVEGALKFYTSFSLGRDAVWDDTLDNSILAFSKGNLAIYFGYSNDVFSLRSLNPNLEYQVASVPSLAGRNSTVASYWAEGISVKTKHSEEALLFLQYLSRPETLTKLNQIKTKISPIGVLYPRKSMSPLLSSNDLMYPFVAQADNAQTTYFSADTYDGEKGMISQMNVYLGNAIRSINNNSSVSSATEDLINGVNQVLSRY